MDKQQGVAISEDERKQIEVYAELNDMDYETALSRLLEQRLEESISDIRAFLRNRKK